MASSPSTPTTPPSSAGSQPQPQPQTRRQATSIFGKQVDNPLVHNVALGVTPLALGALFLPPRRLDLRAIMLGGVAVWGTNQLAYDFTGKSYAQRFNSRMAALTATELPEKARETQARLREERERRAKLRALRDEMVRSGAVKAGGDGVEGWTDEQKRALLEAYERQRRQEQAQREQVAGVGKDGEKGLLHNIWMGDAPPDWKEQRDKKEKEALQDGGGGYWGLITDQIAEVWRGKKTDQSGDSKKTGDDDDAAAAAKKQ